jgi:hypothetical protein
MDIVREFRALATGSRYAHRGQQPPEYGCTLFKDRFEPSIAWVSFQRSTSDMDHRNFLPAGVATTWRQELVLTPR